VRLDPLVHSYLWECRQLSTNMVCREMRAWLVVGNSGSWDDAVRSGCSTECMLYSVYAVLGVNCSSWHGEIGRDNITSCS
jgi:hypothetical protein